MNKAIDLCRRELMLGMFALPLVSVLPSFRTTPPMTVAEAIGWLHQVGLR
jgi:hypothetical protein